MGLPTAADVQDMMAHASDDRRAAIIATMVVCTILAYVAVGMRFWSRRLARAAIKADDWTIVAALFSVTAFTVCCGVTVYYGMGRHVIFVTDAKSLVIVSIVGQVSYVPCIFFIKASICLLYHRLFPQKWLKYALLATMAVVLASNIAAIFYDIFECVPISSQWDPTVAGSCIDLGKAVLIGSTIHTVTDFVMLGLPLPIIWQLQMSVTRKWLISGMFLLGAFVSAISIVRLFYVTEVGSVDPSWSDVNTVILSAVEISTGVLAACLTTCRPLFNYIFKRSATVQGSHNSKKFHHRLVQRDSYSNPTAIELSIHNKTWTEQRSQYDPNDGMYDPLDPRRVRQT